MWLAGVLRAPQAAVGPTNAVIQSQLARPLPVLRFDGVSLRDVLEFMKDVSGCPVEVDWPALAAVGVTSGSPVNVALSNVRLGDGLAALLQAHKPAIFVSRGNAIFVSTPAAMDGYLRSQSVPTGREEGNVTVADWRVLEWVLGSNRWTIATNRGLVQVWRNPADPAAAYQRPAPGGIPSGTPVAFAFAGMALERSPFPLLSLRIDLPLWIVVASTAVLPLVRVARWCGRIRRKRAGLCPSCGYDLRATPDLCPECGTPAAVSNVV